MTKVTNKIDSHRSCSFAFRVLVPLKMSFKILMISIYVVCRRVASCRHFTCDSLQHYSFYIWIIASIRSRHLDCDLWGRDEKFTLNLFKYIFIEGAQWLSGRVLDSRPKGRGFEPHRRHCVVVLEQDIFILA